MSPDIKRYIGIENELSSYLGKVRMPFSHFKALRKSFNNVYQLSSTSIRTETGHGFYMDGDELEILTPPVLINKGFATRLIDLLLFGRNAVVNASSVQSHAGYSMHWNLTDSGTIPYDRSFWSGIAIPFSLFALTPLSVGAASRHKTNRFELLGDSLNNEPQLKATALMLGSYLLARECKKLPPVLYRGQGPEITPEGRHTKVPVFIKNDKPGKPPEYFEYESVVRDYFQEGVIEAQQVLRGFYHWLRPFAELVGTKSEVENLDALVTGAQSLEFDKFKFYAQLSKKGYKPNRHYVPGFRVGGINATTTIKSVEGRELPLEGRLWGSFLQECDRIDAMSWTGVNFYDREGLYQCLMGIEKISNYANHTLLAQKRKLRGVSLTRANKIKSLDSFEVTPEIGEYKPEKDESVGVEPKNQFLSIIKEASEEFKSCFKYFSLKEQAVAFSLIGLVFSGIGTLEGYLSRRSALRRELTGICALDGNSNSTNREGSTNNLSQVVQTNVSQLNQTTGNTENARNNN